MTRFPSRIISAALVTTLVLVPTVGAASGFIPAPEVRQELRSFRACLAQLKAAYKEDRRMVQTREVTADGISREVALETRTKGVQRSGRTAARYHGRVWAHNGRITLPGSGQREVSHSWTERDMQCDGRVLTRKGAQGFTMSTFEPDGAAVR